MQTKISGWRSKHMERHWQSPSMKCSSNQYWGFFYTQPQTGMENILIYVWRWQPVYHKNREKSDDRLSITRSTRQVSKCAGKEDFCLAFQTFTTATTYFWEKGIHDYNRVRSVFCFLCTVALGSLCHSPNSLRRERVWHVPTSVLRKRFDVGTLDLPVLRKWFDVGTLICFEKEIWCGHAWLTVRQKKGGKREWETVSMHPSVNLQNFI